jgi:lipoprotein-anchoring transpeptidase ErfK/SrfK
MNGRVKTAIGFLALFIAAFPVVAQTATGVVAADLAAAQPAMDRQPTVTRVIVVSLADRRLALVEDGVVKETFRVAVGRESSPSPTGSFTIVRRVANPTYYHDGKVIPPGPGNPVGTRWMGLSKAGYGIHGTNESHSIGRAASHGCIRMAQPDLEHLFAEVRSGDTVEIVGERNEETAAIFGEPTVPAHAATAVQTATATQEGSAAGTDTAAAAMVPAGR